MHRLLAPQIATPDATPCSVAPGRTVWEAPLGFARVVLDTEAFDFHLDIDYANASPQVAAVLIARLRALGLEPLDEDECEPELLSDDFVRIYFTPTVPMDDKPLIPLGAGTSFL